MEAARPAIEAFGIDRQPGVESIGSHFFECCVESSSAV
jgi:hypothetical protein